MSTLWLYYLQYVTSRTTSFWIQETIVYLVQFVLLFIELMLYKMHLVLYTIICLLYCELNALSWYLLAINKVEKTKQKIKCNFLAVSRTFRRDCRGCFTLRAKITTPICYQQDSSTYPHTLVLALPVPREVSHNVHRMLDSYNCTL